MGQFEVETVVHRSVEDVFDYLSDVENTPNWYSAVQTARLVEGGGPGLGAKYRIVRNLPQGTVEDVVEVSEFERPSAFRFGTDDGATPFSYRYTLESDGDDTRVKLDAEITVNGAARLLGPIATQAFKRGMQDNLQALAARLERR